MQYQEGHDDDIGQRSQEIIFDLPSEGSNESTRESDVPQYFVEHVEREAPAPAVNPFFKWLQRAVAVLSIFSMAVLVFLGAVSAFRIVMDVPSAGSDVATKTQPGAATNSSPVGGSGVTTTATPANESDIASNVSPSAGSDVTTDDLEESFDDDTPSFGRGFATVSTTTATRSTFRRKRSKWRRVGVAGYQSTRLAAPLRQPLEPLFFPTTLVIYVENGEIKSRLEPWIQATPTPDN